jgi:hypothetical protein
LIVIMRKTSLVLLAAVSTLLPGQTSNRPLADLACVEEMAIPDYSGALRVGWIARVAGTARVLVTVSPSGAPAAVDVQSSSSMLTGVLKQSFADARFSTRCAGQVVEINFIYVQRGEAAQPVRQSIRLRNANTFEIVANVSPAIVPQP